MRSVLDREVAVLIRCIVVGLSQQADSPPGGKDNPGPSAARRQDSSVRDMKSLIFIWRANISGTVYLSAIIEAPGLKT